MPDVRTFFDAQCLFAFHLGGKEVTVKIAKVTGGELVGHGGKKTKKPMLFFAGKELPLGLNKTNVKTIGAAFGFDTKEWIGKEIVLYPTTTQFGSETVDCIRVRVAKPGGARRDGPPTQREPGQDDD